MVWEGGRVERNRSFALDISETVKNDLKEYKNVLSYSWGTENDCLEVV